MMRATITLFVLLAACDSKGDSKRDDPRDKARAYIERSKQAEAKVGLSAIRHQADSYFTENARYPIGSAPATPAGSCCGKPKDACPPDPSLWVGPWAELRFRVEEPSRFHYSYDSDGKTYTAIAVGDVMCDEHTTRYKITNDSIEVVGPY